MKPNMLHRVCAHPTGNAWFLGTVALGTWAVAIVAGGLSQAAVLLEPEVLLRLALVAVLLPLAGLFMGAFARLPIAWLCARYNGAPFQVGDVVRIMAGPRKGTVAEVYEIAIGQGNERLLRLDLGPEERASYGDLFGEYSVLRMPKDGQHAATAQSGLEPPAGGNTLRAGPPSDSTT